MGASPILRCGRGRNFLSHLSAQSLCPQIKQLNAIKFQYLGARSAIIQLDFWVHPEQFFRVTCARRPSRLRSGQLSSTHLATHTFKNARGPVRKEILLIATTFGDVSWGASVASAGWLCFLTLT